MFGLLRRLRRFLLGADCPSSARIEVVGPLLSLCSLQRCSRLGLPGFLLLRIFCVGRLRPCALAFLFARGFCCAVSDLLSSESAASGCWGVADQVLTVQDCAFDQSLNTAQARLFRGVDERPSNTVGTCAPGAANAMHIAFRFVWQLVVDYMRNLVNINASGCDVGSD